MAAGSFEGLPEMGATLPEGSEPRADKVAHGASATKKGVRPSVVYFAQAGTDGPIKIGFSKSFKQRIASIEASTFEPIRILAVVNGGINRERALHRRFRADRIKSEWFRPSTALMAYIETLEPYVGTPPMQPRAPTTLQQWREAMGWTRKRAAAHLKVSERTIENWEYGHRTPMALGVLEGLLIREIGIRRKKAKSS